MSQFIHKRGTCLRCGRRIDKANPVMRSESGADRLHVGCVTCYVQSNFGPVEYRCIDCGRELQAGQSVCRRCNAARNRKARR